ncbi:lectin C-type domain protein [Ostertagia ostertagi]
MLSIPMLSCRRILIQELKIKPLFEAKVVNGWSIWPQGERAYKVFVQKATWDEAEEICQQNDAHLASIGSEEENDFIYKALQQFLLTYRRTPCPALLYLEDSRDRTVSRKADQDKTKPSQAIRHFKLQQSE